MENKILTFIYNKKENKFLLLNMTKHPDHSPEGGWFVVTGGIESNESNEEAVKRELLEETGLKSKFILPLNWGSTYIWKGKECKEMNFITFVDSMRLILNEEHSDYLWLGLNKFIKKIDWKDNKKLLKKVLEKAKDKEIFFDKKEREI